MTLDGNPPNYWRNHPHRVDQDTGKWRAVAPDAFRVMRNRRFKEIDDAEEVAAIAGF